MAGEGSGKRGAGFQMGRGRKHHGLFKREKIRLVSAGRFWKESRGFHQRLNQSHQMFGPEKPVAHVQRRPPCAGRWGEGKQELHES